MKLMLGDQSTTLKRRTEEKKCQSTVRWGSEAHMACTWPVQNTANFRRSSVRRLARRANYALINENGRAVWKPRTTPPWLWDKTVSYLLRELHTCSRFQLAWLWPGVCPEQFLGMKLFQIAMAFNLQLRMFYSCHSYLPCKWLGWS